MVNVISSGWLVLALAVPPSAEAACPPGQILETTKLDSGEVLARGCIEKEEGGNSKRQGLWTYWYVNGQKEVEGTYKADLREGLWTIWYENGQKKMTAAFKAGKLEGPVTSWYENGQKGEEGTYKAGLKEGLWTSWDESGQRIGTVVYRKSKPIDP